MMLRRERMYRDPVVQAELERAWQAVSAASARAVPSDEHDGAATIGWQQYAQLCAALLAERRAPRRAPRPTCAPPAPPHPPPPASAASSSRKLYLCLMKRSDPHEAFLLAKLDWERDTRGWPDAATPLMERVIDRATFFRSWFELADVNTDDMEEETYGRFIERTIRLIVRTDARSGACMLRSDAEVMNLVVKNGGLHIESRARMSRAPAYAPPKENARFHQQTIASKAAQRDRFTRAPVLAASTGLSPRSATQGLSAASPMRASKSQPAMLTRAQLTEPPDRQPARANDARPHELPEDAPPARAAATAPGAEPPSRSPPLAPLLRHARTAVALLPPLPALALKRTGTMPATAWHSTPDWHSTRDSAPHALAEAAAAGPVPETVDAPSKPRLRRRAQSKPDNPKPDSLTLSRKAGALALALSDDERGAAPRLRELVGLPARERRAQSLDGLALQAPLPAIRSARSHSHAGLVALAEQPRRRAVSLGGPRSVGQRRLSRPVVGLAIRTSAARAPGLFARAPQAVVSPTSGVHVAHRRESDASVVGGGGKGGKAAAPRWIGMSLSSVAR